jgi:DNA replication protein DnaD
MNEEYEESSQGWISVLRKIRFHWIWGDPQSFKAWITILFTVNHLDKKVLIQGELLECKRGQSLLSLAGWAKIFGKKWTIQRVRTFFKLLEKDGMITINGLRKTTRLTVCNYDNYQKQQQTDNIQRTSRQQQTIRKNNFNKGDLEKNGKIVDKVFYNNPITNETR